LFGCRQQDLFVYVFLNDDVFRRKSSAEALQALVTPEIFEGIAIRSLKNIKRRNNE
jgi:hypothetical protein